MTGFLALLLLAVQQTPTAERAQFAARYDPTGLEFEAAPDATLRIGAVAMWRGARRVALAPASPRDEGAFTLFDRAPGVVERFERVEGGIEHSLVVDGPVGGDGDLVVRVELGGTTSELGERLPDGSHTFGAISYGRLFGIDANGARTDGDVRLVEGGLELVIDDAWLDAAAWPITLDPVIGTANIVTTSIPVSSLDGDGEVDDDPDAAYDVTNGCYLHAFVRTTLGNASPPLPPLPIEIETLHAQRLTSAGLPTGPLLELDVTTVREPRVANAARRDRFAVSWIDNVGLGDELNLRLVDADDSALSGTLNIAPEDGPIMDHDLAGESSLSTLTTSRVFAVWIDGAGDVQFARISVPASGGASLSSTITIAADPGVSDEWKEVSIARCTNDDGELAIALVRESSFLGTRRVYAMMVDRNGTVVTPLTLVSGSDDDCQRVSVDGGGSNPSRWVVTWEEANIVTFTQFTLRAVALAGSGSSLTASTIRSHGTSFTRFDAQVGWRPGMAIVAFERPFSDEISVCMLCDTTAQIGEEASTAFDWPDTALIDYDTSDAVVALRTSGGDTSAHEGLLLCRRVGTSSISTQTVIASRRYDAFDPNATVTTLSFGCGGVGSIGVSTLPAIGNPDFRVELTGARPGAAVAILNVAAPQPLATCGSCTFAVLETLYILPIVGGAAAKALPIPCNPSLAGVRADVQWIVYEPGIAPCSPVPDFGATGLLRLTLN